MMYDQFSKWTSYVIVPGAGYSYHGRSRQDPGGLHPPPDGVGNLWRKKEVKTMKPLNLELERLENRIAPGGIGLPDVDISASAEASGSGSKSSGSKGSGSKESGSKGSASKSSGSKGSGSK